MKKFSSQIATKATSAATKSAATATAVTARRNGSRIGKVFNSQIVM